MFNTMNKFTILFCNSVLHCSIINHIEFYVGLTRLHNINNKYTITETNIKASVRLIITYSLEKWQKHKKPDRY